MIASPGCSKNGSLPEGLGGGAQFGTSVLFADGTAAIGAPGAAAVFAYDVSEGSAGEPMSTLRAFDQTDGSRFGFSLAAADGDLWVGAPGVAGDADSTPRQ